MMPPEGPNKTDELLRRYAKERRDKGGDFSLHPATRQMLQGEVARQFSSSRTENISGWLSWLVRWRRGFIAAGACVVIAVVCWAFWEVPREGSRMELAKASMTERELSASSAVRTMAESPASSIDTLERSIELKVAPVDAARLDDSARRLGRSEVPTTANMPAPAIPSVDTPGLVTTFYAEVAVTNSAANLGVRLQDANSALTLQKPPSEPATGRLLATGNYQQSLSYSVNAGAGGVVNQAADGAVVANAQNLSAGGIAMNQAPAGPQGLLQNELNTTLRRESLEAEKKKLTEQSLAANKSADTKAEAQSTPPAQAPAAPAPSAVGTEVAATIAGDAYQRVDTRAVTGTRFYRMRSNYGAESVAERQSSPAGQAVAANGFQVLDNFVIEQGTNGVRVVDADGSVYVGQIGAQGPVGASDKLSELRSKDLDEREGLIAGKPELPARPAGYSFRAFGSNVTLRQNVEVLGRFATETNASPNAGIAGAAPARRAIAPTQDRRSGAAGRLNAVESDSVEGTVRVGQSPEQRFRAVRQAR